MKAFTIVAVFVLAIAGTMVFAQNSSNQVVKATPSSTVAYVYVSRSASSGVSQIKAYKADSTGRLTAVPGSPFNDGGENISQMAVNGEYLFGSNNTYIYSFTIASNGALQQVSQINASSYNPSGGGPANLFLDHTGATLYDVDFYAYGTGNSAYQAFSVDQSTGQLNFLQLTANGGVIEHVPLSFIGSNSYAYSAGSYQDSGNIFGFRRSSDGTLTALNINPPIPTAPNGGYAPYLAAADPNNNLAVTLTPFNGFTPTGPTQIAVYTASKSGKLTTNSTAKNMPKVQGSTNSYVTDLKMAPSGQLLAVAGGFGLQVFHFNGANPATNYTSLLTNVAVDQTLWDDSNHLYAVSRSTAKLYVFTVTPTTHLHAPGSPYTITGAESLIVLPKT